MIALRHWPVAAWTIATTFGLRAGVMRAIHEARRACGLFRVRPRDRTASGKSVLVTLQVNRSSLSRATVLESARSRGDRVCRGQYQAFRWDWRALPPTAEAWGRHPDSGAIWDVDAPWWRVKHYSAERGDIKDLWEPARFGWVYDLIRAHALTDDERYVDAFIQLFAYWKECARPFRGPHWACGQETAIRAIALLYAEANLPLDEITARSVKEALVLSGERINDAIGYALSQRNNHGISEAVGLIALGIRFRDATPAAKAWLKRGERLLNRLVVEQFAEDGWYIQHSFTYMRLALDQCVIAERVLRSVGRGLSPAAVERLRAAVALLIEVIDTDTGEAPNHGASDGAFVHPITSAAYRDMRPVITAGATLWDVPLPADIPFDAETLAWLDAAPPRRAPMRRDGVCYGRSGWVLIRRKEFRVFQRAGFYRTRPGHIDPLHVDISVSGREVIVDPGTYSYAAPPPWRNGLAGSDVHNGPRLTNNPYEMRGPRFLWYRWPKASVMSVKEGTDTVTVESRASPGLRRSVFVTDDEVRIVDTAERRSMYPFEVLWLLHPTEADYGVVVDGEVERIVATSGNTRGWYSPAYGNRVQSVGLRVLVDGVSRTTLETSFPLPSCARQARHPDISPDASVSAEEIA